MATKRSLSPGFLLLLSKLNVTEELWDLVSVGNVDRDIGRHSGRYGGRQSVDSRYSVDITHSKQDPNSNSVKIKFSFRSHQLNCARYYSQNGILCVDMRITNCLRRFTTCITKVYSTASKAICTVKIVDCNC